MFNFSIFSRFSLTYRFTITEQCPYKEIPGTLVIYLLNYRYYFVWLNCDLVIMSNKKTRPYYFQVKYYYCGVAISIFLDWLFLRKSPKLNYNIRK